jgi:Bacteriophage protein gp37
LNRTLIEWVKNPDGTQGYTWNPITGCLNHIGGLCKGGGFPCYAYKLAHGRLRGKYLANSILPTHDEPNHEEHHTDPFYPRFWPDRLEDIKRGYHYTDRFGACEFGAKAKGIFVCDMSDLFGIGIPKQWTKSILSYIKSDPQDRFYLLTKQPQNLIKFSPFPDNCWVGVTVCTNGMMTMALQYLSMIQAKVKYISFEPLLGMIGMDDHMSMKGIVDWLIIGAQTKPYKPPKIEWVGEIIQSCRQANIPIFLKNNLQPIIENENIIQEIP